MTAQVMKYKEHIGSVDFDFDDGCLHGKLLYINDLVTYEAETLPALKEEFEASVDDYIETCRELGVEPNRPFKGSFNVRIGQDLHKKIVYKAAEAGIAVNEAVSRAISDYVTDSSRKKLIDDVGDQIRRHVYQASLQAISVRPANEHRSSAPNWTDNRKGMKSTYTVNAGRVYEH